MNKVTGLACDLGAISLFALLARIAHRSADQPVTLATWASTVWPFALGVIGSWAIIAAARWRGGQLAPAGVTTWLVTVVTGLGIWGIRHQAVPHWSFIIVASSMSALLLLGWRVAQSAWRKAPRGK
ncbi:DUF3054 domain-containing protein [Corynebacterium uterequi]|uniref:Putative DUF3054 family protein n=1 Tax=Corynebacterium uterequi TaxID=1072256 RepID=A0A0G3HFB0_9CORY|nr:DUF3054 domain-containing protein [Corynebacterium uterequi]AKK12041.1 putative DUF3054 family protein [Corynebacterium uterequi]